MRYVSILICGVVVVDVQVTHTLQSEAHARMLRESREHLTHAASDGFSIQAARTDVVKEADASRDVNDLRISRARPTVKVERDIDHGFACLARELSGAGCHDSGVKASVSVQSFPGRRRRQSRPFRFASESLCGHIERHIFSASHDASYRSLRLYTPLL
jgi:hypothetical protein